MPATTNSNFGKTLYVAVLSVLLFVNLIVLNRLLKSKQDIDPYNDDIHSYIGADFPLDFPIPNIPDVEVFIEESARFRLGQDKVVSDAWVYTLPRNSGFGRLGKARRMFAISMYHEMHCLFEIHQQISFFRGSDPHVQHCLNYIRQNVLCTADLTVEPDFNLPGNATTTTVGGFTRTCKNWEAIGEAMERNYATWLELKTQPIV